MNPFVFSSEYEVWDLGVVLYGVFVGARTVDNVGLCTKVIAGKHRDKPNNKGRPRFPELWRLLNDVMHEATETENAYKECHRERGTHRADCSYIDASTLTIWHVEIARRRRRKEYNCRWWKSAWRWNAYIICIAYCATITAYLLQFDLY